MTRHEKRQYLVATGLATVAGFILAIVILTEGRGRDAPRVFDSVSSVLELDDRATGATDVATRAVTSDRPSSVGASQPLPSEAEAIPETSPRADTETGNVTAQTSEHAMRLPGEPPSHDADSLQDASPTLHSDSGSLIGRRLEPGGSGGFAPAAFATGHASALTGGDTTVGERTVSQVSLQAASGARTAGHHLADSAASQTILAPSSASASTALEDLMASNRILDPIVVRRPDSFGESALTILDVFGQAPSLDLSASSVAEQTLKASLGPVGANLETLSIPAASAGGSTIVNPEPATLLLFGTGLGLAARYAQRRRQRSLIAEGRKTRSQFVTSAPDPSLARNERSKSGGL